MSSKSFFSKMNYVKRKKQLLSEEKNHNFLFFISSKITINFKVSNNIFHYFNGAFIAFQNAIVQCSIKFLSNMIKVNQEIDGKDDNQTKFIEFLRLTLCRLHLSFFIYSCNKELHSLKKCCFFLLIVSHWNLNFVSSELITRLLLWLKRKLQITQCLKNH